MKHVIKAIPEPDKKSWENAASGYLIIQIKFCKTGGNIDQKGKDVTHHWINKYCFMLTVIQYDTVYCILYTVYIYVSFFLSLLKKI